MTNATPQSLMCAPSSLRSVPPAARDAPPELEPCLRGFLKGFALHALPAEPADARCRRMVRVLQPHTAALPDAAVEVLRDVAVVAEIAVEARLRAFLAESSRPQILPLLSQDRSHYAVVEF